MNARGAKEIETALGGVTLRPLDIHDAENLFGIIDRSRAHLEQSGDYDFPDDYDLDDVRRYFEDPPDNNLRFGIWEGGELRGRIDLNPIAPPHWSIGYFLDESATGRGLATAACRAVESVALSAGAADLYAGVTIGNDKSCAVLERAGYQLIQELPDRTRWWRPLTDDPDPPVMMRQSA